MKLVSNRYVRRLLPVALAFALISALAPVTTAEAATLTNVSVQPADATKNVATTWKISSSASTAGSVKCLYVYADTLADFSSTSAAAVFSGTPTGSTYFTAGTWDAGAAAVASTSAYKWVSTGGVTAAGGATKDFSVSVTNPNSAATFYVQVKTFSDTGCATPVDVGTSTVTTTDNTVVSVTVDPTFTFAVNSQPTSTVCNGLTTSNVASTANTVNFGHLASGSIKTAVQQLEVSTNAGGNWVVYLRSKTASGAVLTGNNSHTIANVASGALPSAGAAFFGYTTDSSSAAVTSGNVKPVPNSAGNDVVGNGAAGTLLHNCVGYAVGASASTPADSYTATMVYTAVPTF